MYDLLIRKAVGIRLDFLFQTENAHSFSLLLCGLIHLNLPDNPLSILI